MTAYLGTVRRTTRLSPGLVRLTVAGEELASFPSTGVGDEYVRVHFPDETGLLRIPSVDDSGEWHYEGGEYPHIAPYTIRRHDPLAAEIDIDFVLHGHGRAATWAAGATVGESVIFGAPRGLYEPPLGAQRQIFVTDATGLPALGRLLEQLDPATHAIAIVEVEHADHAIPLTSPARLDVQWIAGRGNGVAPSAITEALEHLEITPETYVWVAGESKELRKARRHLRHERALAASQYKVIGYWTHKHEEWLERYEALDQATLTRLSGIWENVVDEELGRDLYEEQLERLGL